MKTTLNLIYERATSKYWIIPSVISVAIMLLFFWARSIPNDAFKHGISSFIAFDASPSGARQLLSAVAGGVMTVVGVLFSITVVVLQQASSQYSPRVIENFVRSIVSQVVFGLYIGTFIYCLLLVRQIRDQPAAQGTLVPGAAISIATVLAIVCMALLIWYVHHILHSIQSTHIIASIRKEVMRVIDSLQEGDDRSNAHRLEGHVQRENKTQISLHDAGYLQAIETRKLSRQLELIRGSAEILTAPGDYIDPLSGPVITVYSPAPLSEREIRKIRASFETGTARTHAQDVRFGIRQIVDIALRALSPSVNDPTTAIECLNALQSILLYAAKSFQSSPQKASSPRLLIVREISFDTLLSLSFDQILTFSGDHPSIQRRILMILNACEKMTSREPLAAIKELRLRAERLYKSSTANESGIRAAS